jgi:hypothetical protein
MTWGKLAGLFSLKAILLAVLLTPVAIVTTGMKSAQAQFVIGGFRINIYGHGYRGRRYARHRGYSRYSRRGRHRGGQQQEQASAPGSTAPATQGTQALSAPATSSRGYRGSTD